MTTQCRLCPRECGADRKNNLGFCGCGEKIKVAGAYLHKWEEPCISGEGGSGTIFFSGCTMKCVFCQNFKITHDGFGKEISPQRLSEIMLELEARGAENISLVTPTHFTEQILKSLDAVKHKLKIPVVFNCGGYEKAQTIARYKGYIDIYLPDFKYYDDALAKRYSAADNYCDSATSALKEMLSQVGPPILKDGIMHSGVLVRHLIMPSHYKDSLNILQHLKKEIGSDKILLSLMSQFTPTQAVESYSEINRRITTYEYQRVVDLASELGFDGYMQERSSASEEYIPPFNLEGI